MALCSYYKQIHTTIISLFTMSKHSLPWHLKPARLIWCKTRSRHLWSYWDYPFTVSVTMKPNTETFGIKRIFVQAGGKYKSCVMCLSLLVRLHAAFGKSSITAESVSAHPNTSSATGMIPHRNTWWSVRNTKHKARLRCLQPNNQKASPREQQAWRGLSRASRWSSVVMLSAGVITAFRPYTCVRLSSHLVQHLSVSSSNDGT